MCAGQLLNFLPAISLCCARNIFVHTALCVRMWQNSQSSSSFSLSLSLCTITG